MVTKSTAENKLEAAETFANPVPDNSFTRNFVVAHATQSEGEEETESEYEFGKITFDSDAHTDLQENILSRLIEQTSALDCDEKYLEPYDIANSGRNELIQYIGTSEIPSFERYEPLVERERFEETTYDEENDGSTPDFQAMRITGGSTDSTIIVFQKYSSNQVVGKDWMLKLLKRSGNEYNLVNEDLVAIPKRIDALYVDGIIYAFNTRKFEAIFDHLKTYRDKARTVFDEIKNAGIVIENREEFFGYIENDGNALRKMQKVENKGIYQQLEQEDAEQIIKDYDLDLDVKDNEEQLSIEVPSPQKKWEMIRLLNDNHLYSEFTESRYRVYGKQSNSE